MKEHDTFKVRTFHCEVCREERESLQWNYDPAPVCCEQPMVEGRGRRATVQIITDDVPGGFTVENGFSSPQTFYSKREHREALGTGMRHGRKVGPGGLRLMDRGEV